MAVGNHIQGALPPPPGLECVLEFKLQSESELALELELELE